MAAFPDVEAVHWSALGKPDSLDTDIILSAEQHGYIVLTQDLDFGNLLAISNRRKPSVVQLRTEELSPDVIGAQVIQALRQFQMELAEGALTTFDPRRTRVRILPFHSGSKD
jgi:predicted nuclease of predicted toxin-antitoxin system